jgi:hypothetical protein
MDKFVYWGCVQRGVLAAMHQICAFAAKSASRLISRNLRKNYSIARNVSKTRKKRAAMVELAFGMAFADGAVESVFQ